MNGYLTGKPCIWMCNLSHKIALDVISVKKILKIQAVANIIQISSWPDGNGKINHTGNILHSFIAVSVTADSDL